jgi:hypothetical protein
MQSFTRFDQREQQEIERRIQIIENNLTCMKAEVGKEFSNIDMIRKWFDELQQNSRVIGHFINGDSEDES